MPFHDEQLRFVIWMSEQIRTPYLDPFFRFLNYFDGPYFFLFALPIVWFGISYKWGLRFFYLCALSSILNSYAKIFIGWPRPSQDLPSLGMFDFTSYGFPSGGAQTAFLLGSLLIYYGKSRLAWTLGMVYILLISFSRIYLGAHYPIDILGGWIIGFALFLLFVFSIDQIEKFLNRIGFFPAFLLSQIIPLTLFIITRKYLLIGTMAVGIGAYFTYRYSLFLPPPATFYQRSIRALFAILLSVPLYFLWPNDFYMQLGFFIQMLWISLAIGPLLKLPLHLE